MIKKIPLTLGFALLFFFSFLTSFLFIKSFSEEQKSPPEPEAYLGEAIPLSLSANQLGPGELDNIQVKAEPHAYDNGNYTVKIIINSQLVQSYSSLIGSYFRYYMSGSQLMTELKTVNFVKVGDRFEAILDSSFSRGKMDLNSPQNSYIASFCYSGGYIGLNAKGYLEGARCDGSPNKESDMRISYGYDDYIYGYKAGIISLSLPFNKNQTPNFKPTNYVFYLESETSPEKVHVEYLNFRPNTIINSCSQPNAAVGIYTTITGDPNAEYYPMHSYPDYSTGSCWYTTEYGAWFFKPFPHSKYLALVENPNPTPSSSPSPSPSPSLSPSPSPSPSPSRTPSPSPSRSPLPSPVAYPQCRSFTPQNPVLKVGQSLTFSCQGVNATAADFQVLRQRPTDTAFIRLTGINNVKVDATGKASYVYQMPAGPAAYKFQCRLCKIINGTKVCTRWGQTTR